MARCGRRAPDAPPYVRARRRRLWALALAVLVVAPAGLLRSASPAQASATGAPADPVDVAATYAPAAYGAAAGDTGGAGGPTVVVTSLADSGPGTLRDAVSVPQRVVQFGVSGIISLSRDIPVSSQITIDGRGADVTIQRYGLVIAGVHDVIVRNLRFQHGIGGDSFDAIQVRAASQRVWIDHNELSDYMDGLIDVTQLATNVTISWNLLHDHGKTSLLGAADPGGTPALVDISVDHNWYLRTGERAPKMRAGRFHVYDNLVEDFGYSFDHGSGLQAGCGAVALVEEETFVETPGWARDALKNTESGCDPTRTPALRLSDVDTGGSVVPAGLSDAVPGPGQWPDSAAVEPMTPDLLRRLRLATGWHCISPDTAGVAVGVTIDQASLHAQYDGAPHAAAAATDPPGVTLNLAYFDAAGLPVIGAPVDAGAYTVAAAACSPGVQTGDVAATLVIDPVPVAVQAHDLTRPYGDASPAPTGDVTGLIPSDGIGVSFSDPGPLAPVGSYPVTPVFADRGARLGNYTVTSTPATLTVTPRPAAVVAGDGTRLYGDTAPAPTGTVTGLVDADGITVAYPDPGPAAPVGTYPVVPALSDPGGRLGNYTLTVTPATLTVGPRPLLVQASDATVDAGSPIPDLTGTVTGLVDGDGVTAAYTTTATADSPPGDYPITPVLADPGGRLVNYTVTLGAGTLHVAAVPVSVAIDPASLHAGYDGQPHPVAVATDPVGGAVTVTYADSAGTVLPGPPTAAGTYTVTAQATNAISTAIPVSGTLVIDPRPLTVTASDASTTYGSAVPALTGTVSGLVPADQIGVGFTTPAGSTSPVGTYAVTPALTDPLGRLSNYVVTLTPGTLTVVRAPLSVAAASASRVYGSANPVLGGSLAGVVAGDGITASYSTAATAASPVGAYPVTPSLSDPLGRLSNYVVTSTPGMLTVVRAPLSVAAANASRIYGSANPVLGGTLAGVVAGDGITASFSTAATAVSPVGSYPVTPTLADPLRRLANYSVTSVAGKLTVTKAPLTVTAANASRPAGTANPVFTVSFAGFVNGDGTSALTGVVACTTTATTTSPAGTYPITCGGLSGANYSVQFVAGTLTVTGGASNVPVVTLKSGGKGAAVVSWTAVAGADEYTWQLRTCAGVTVVSSSTTALSKTKTGLAAGCYTARVRARVSKVYQPWSATVTATLP